MIAKDYNSNFFKGEEKKDELYFVDAYLFTYLLCVPIDPDFVVKFFLILLSV